MISFQLRYLEKAIEDSLGILSAAIHGDRRIETQAPGFSVVIRAMWVVNQQKESVFLYLPISPLIPITLPFKE